jgi:hypothetical protein
MKFKYVIQPIFGSCEPHDIQFSDYEVLPRL